ncbi:MAG: chaperonin GroEL [Acidimicrobiia bacterium]|nr:chaperonin GroEL [Acidimicrobiia bacterium]
MKSEPQSSLVFQPRTHRHMQRGVNKVVKSIRPTLGPTPRVVAVDRLVDQRMPEILDNGAVIAQRINELSNRDEDAGAMLVRDVVEAVRQQAGDGTATAAVIFQHIFDAGIRHLSVGGDVNVLRKHLELGVCRIEEQLVARAEPVVGGPDLSHLAESLCHDPDMALLIGEVLDTVGEYGRVEVRAGRNRDMTREYVEGMYWNRGAVSRSMLTDQGRLRTEFIDGFLLLSDIDVQDPRQLLPVVVRALKDGVKSLLIVVGDISDGALAFLAANNDPNHFVSAVVKVPGWGKHENAAALEDLAILTGGTPFIDAAGDRFDALTVEHLGRARRVWIGDSTFGIVGGRGDSKQLLRHINGLKALAEDSDNRVRHDHLVDRIGSIIGGSATLWIGGSTEIQIEQRVEMVKRTVSAMRGAVREGIVPGGGTALLDCRLALGTMIRDTPHPDAKAAYRILAEAIAQPFRTIVDNAGYDVAETLARVNQSDEGYGFDVNTGEIRSMIPAGIIDAAAVQRSAVRCAVTAAALALTVEALVRRPR